MLRWTLFYLSLAAASAASAALPTQQSAPQRVVSINLCADVFLLHLAEREQIASLTFLAGSSPLSPVIDLAKGLPTNHGQIEEVLAQQPDLVLAHRYGNAALVANLKRLGLPVLVMEPPVNLAAVEIEIQRLAQALGQQAKGRQLLLQYAEDKNTANKPDKHAPVMAVYGPNGITSGPGSLLHNVLTRAGFANLAPQLGIGSVGTLRMESLLTHPPDALLFSDSGTRINSLARQKMQHPALQKLAATRPALRLPGKLWTCGGPEVFTAINALRELRATLP